MKKKPGKAQGKSRRSTVKDLPVKKGGGVTGGVEFNEFRIVKVLDKATPKLYQ